MEFFRLGYRYCRIRIKTSMTFPPRRLSFQPIAFLGRDVIGQYIGIGLLLPEFFTCVYLHITIPSSICIFLGIAPVIIVLGIVSIEWVIRRLQSLYSQRCCLSCRWLDCKWRRQHRYLYTTFYDTFSKRKLIFFYCILLMTAIWCAGAFYLVQHRTLGAPLRKYGQHVLPYFLIGLGLFVLLR